MVIFYKKWKKYNEIQLTKNKMDLNIRKMTNHPPSPVWHWRTQAEHSRLKSGPPLVRVLNVHKNIPVSGTKQTLGLRVGFISSHFIVDKLFPVNPRAITSPQKMSLLLEAKSMPALIIKPRLLLVSHMDDLGWNKTSNHQQQMLFKTTGL